MIFRLVAICLCSLLLANGCTEPTTTSQPREVSIAYLKSLCSGDSYRIAEEYTIRGTLLATDWLGEIYKSAIVADESGGVEFAIDIPNINERLPIYSTITIFCNNLTLARIGHKIVLRLPTDGNTSLGAIEKDMVERYIRIEGMCEEYEFTTKQISDIQDRDIGQIIRIDNLRLSEQEQGLSWCDFVDGEAVTTLRHLCNSKGDTLPIRILPTCKYAKERIPTNEISVIGVIDYSDNRYSLQIVNKWVI